jgi:hypothetical protein
VRTARVHVDEKGDWILTVAGTDIRKRLWNDEEVLFGSFPGASMGHRLVELGWMPDRRAMYASQTASRAEQMYLSAMAGWRQVGDEKTWTIPCYPHRELH